MHTSALTTRWQNTAAGAILMQQYSLDAVFNREGEAKTSGQVMRLLQDAKARSLTQRCHFLQL